MDLTLIRHGLPERRHDTSDPPLSPKGHDQARRVAAWLAGERFDAVYASTMRRAIQTAEPLAVNLGAELTTHPGIVEFDRDSGTYIPMEELKREDYAAWQAFAAGDHGADIVGFQRTVVAALEELIARHASQSIVVFCHGGVINVWTAHILGMAPRLFFEPVYTSIHRYRCARTGQRNLVSLNEVAHLR
jgi:2,3-bisphosphoglycerate-dependent phosphoglycerate mutase